MWRGVTVSYALIALSLFPLAIAGYWVYGNKVPADYMPKGGLLTGFVQHHGHTTSKFVKGLIYMLIIINSLCSYQIYAMPVFDNLEMRYISSKNRQCPWWVRTGFRICFGGISYLVAVAFPFLGRLAALIGGITLPLTYAYPCFMWILIKKPRPNSAMWCINLLLGCLGMILAVLLILAASWNLHDQGVNGNFFKP
ncbi:hypothetical protein HS088_TW07G01377 [Tripterygium wilfordii]|uniref:Amino acid transporter transmembrane domain-containing protein n=2 Tax=Tripterygium wilfordii TaxID=458696 RepID=A0A7J7DHJ7_TRIWF|nr:hypothetical protein HS088_TW07G01377 [Tripterygium wilfordii]